MKTQKNRIGRIAATALAGTLAACSSFEDVKVKPLFNAVYAGVDTKREEGYARVFTGASVGNDTLRVYHHGLNQINGADTSTYFGRNIFGIEPFNIGIEGIVDMRGGESGLFDGQPYYGFRDFNVMKMLGSDWGFVQGTTNGENGNLTMLYGKNMGFVHGNLKPLSMEFFHTAEYKQDAKDSNLTEITADWNVFKGFGIFVRQDTSEFRFDDANYVIGGVWKF